MSERKQQQQSKKNPPQPIDEGWSWLILAGRWSDFINMQVYVSRDSYLLQKKTTIIDEDICIQSRK